MRMLLHASLASTFFLCLACGNDDTGSESECIPGELNCECNMGSCLAGLVCEANICLTPSGDGDGDTMGDGDGSPGDGDGSPGDGDGSPGDGDGSPGDGDGSPGDGDGDGAPGDGDGDGCGAGEELCSGSCTDVMDDDANCGACGNACDVVGSTGGCSNGTCDPALTECVLAEDPPKSCAELCNDLGKSCVNLGCNGMTYYWYGSPNTCAQLSGESNQNDCSYPMSKSGIYIRCCCE